ncbi:ethanolamine permease [Caulobacter ginsengisoli]|uniref:Ethanolamine permease n=1 Tax=Caulobacter ginsengisoli TaxID=400775 RepID=A0ABU0IML5_9CAUL|nr:amino acid permease [Caulobacter ginsengisoli]MDQ0463253.1 ethanolamine permease [Caulobacter ginsengisoli]
MTGVGEPPDVEGVRYETVDDRYFERRGLKRYAGVFSLWALGVGAVISGQYSGWNLGLASGGWGGLLLATGIIVVMYLGLVWSIAEMAAAQPHTGGAYSFARTAMGPWGGFITGLCENVEYVLTAAVVCFFIGSYLGAIFETPPEWQPVYWIVAYLIFVGINVLGVALSFQVTVVITLVAMACLAVFWTSALPQSDFARYALNVGAGGVELPDGHGPFLPDGIAGALRQLPFAVWLFLAIEQLPLAAEESHMPQRDLPKGILLGMFTLIGSALLVIWLNASIPPGAFQLAASGQPILDGFAKLYGEGLAKVLAVVALTGLIASFHAIIFAYGRQIYSLSRAGYFPRWLSITNAKRKTPDAALLGGSLVGLLVMMVVWFTLGSDQGAKVIGGALLNMAVFGAMASYVMQGLSFILLRVRFPNMERPYRSPLGLTGAGLALGIALLTIAYQFQDPIYRWGVAGVAVWFALGILYFALVGRHRLVLSPEEAFAVKVERGT